MKYMVIETFKPDARQKVYARYQAWGRMLPPGLVYLDSWVAEDQGRCFQLMATEEPELFDQWIENWRDLVTFEIVPVQDSPTKVAEMNTRWRDGIPRTERDVRSISLFGLHSRQMEYIRNFSELEKYFAKADVTDVKVFQGDSTLREFIAAMLSYYPWWIVQLYRIRRLLVIILGLVKHEEPEELPNLQPEAISFTPGEAAAFFTVRCAREDHYWMSETPDDKHLRAYFGVVREPVAATVNRFHVITTVFYKHWTGPVYFNLIRPFHHLVVSRMARHALSQSHRTAIGLQ